MDIGKVIEIGERKVATPAIAPAKAPVAPPPAAPKPERVKTPA